ncbi:hypothetical protein M8J77_017591 [Diaphorina citri]|nr:hypothetical protein M8J77_017591 [Diaphorina citri]
MKSKKKMARSKIALVTPPLSQPASIAENRSFMTSPSSITALAMSAHSGEGGGDTGLLLENDIGIVYLPESLQISLNCVVGEHLGVDNQWMKVPAEFILAEVWERDSASVFAPYKEAIKNYTLPYMWLGFNPARTELDEFLICTTAAGFASLEKQLTNEELRLYRLAEKTIEPRTWDSFGSEKDIEEAKLCSTRQKMGLSLELDACSRSLQSREPLVTVEPEAVELRPRTKEVFDLVERTLFDVSVQAIPRTVSTKAQTNTPFRRNAAIQSDHDETLLQDLTRLSRQETAERELDDDVLTQATRVEEFRRSLKSKANLVLAGVRGNEVVDLFDTSADQDLVTTPDTKQSKVKKEEAEVERFEEVEVFADVSSIRGKQISSVSWHPNYGGIVAVAYVTKLSTDCSVPDDKSDRDEVLSTSETSLSYEDSDTESVILPPIEKPKEKTGGGEDGGGGGDDETLATVEKKKLRRTSDLRVWRDQTAPPLPFLELDISKYESETFAYQPFPEEEALDWTSVIRKKLVVLDSNVPELMTAMPGEDDVVIIGQEEFEKLKEKAEKVEELKKKTGRGIHDEGGEGDKARELCYRNQAFEELWELAAFKDSNVKHKGQGDMKRIISRNVLKDLWKYSKKEWPFGPLLLKELQHMYLLSSDDEEEEKVGEDLHQEIPESVLPSSLQALKQKRSQPPKATKRLASSIRAAVAAQRKPASLFEAALERNAALRQKFNRIQGKVKELEPGLEVTDGKKYGKVLEEDPDRDPILGAENAVFVWSVCDNLIPVLVLDSPDEVNVIEFAPHDGNIIAGGLASGMIVIWDITGKIKRVMAEDVSGNLNSVRKKLETKLGWSKELTSERVISPVVITERESSHVLPVMHLQWLHPLIQINSAGEFDLKEPSDKELSYQLISSSLYGKMKFWDMKSKAYLIEQEDLPAKQVRPFADKTLPRNPTELENLNRVWKPFYTVRPVQAANTSNQSITSGTSLKVLPTFVLTKFFVQQPRVTYRKNTSGDNSKPELPQYQFVREKIRASDFPRTVQFGSFSGVTCLTSWTGRLKSRDFDEDARLLWKQEHHDGPVTSLGSSLVNARLLWKQEHHDGPVTSLGSSQFYAKVTLSSGGHEWCIWHDDYEIGPILWKKYDQIIASAIWSPFRPGVFFVAKQDGNIEIWDLLKSNNACVDQIVVCEDRLTVLSCSPHVSDDRSYLGVGDATGTFRLFSIPRQHRDWTEEELNRFQALCDSEPDRKRANIVWSERFSQAHPDRRPVFLSIAEEMERDRALAEEREEAARQAAQKKKKKYEDPTKKWASKRRDLERLGYTMEDKLAHQFIEREKRYFLQAATAKKNIDKCRMELMRKPVMKREMATEHIQDRISQKFERQQREIENVTTRKFPIIKEIMEKAPVATSSASSMPGISDIPSLGSLCSGLEETADIPGVDLEQLTSEKYIGSVLRGVDECAKETEESAMRWSDMIPTYDELRKWLSPYKPYMDVEQWRRLRKHYELVHHMRSATSLDENQLASSISWGSKVISRSEHSREADMMSQLSTMSQLRTVTRVEPIEDTSLLTFSQASQATSVHSKLSSIELSSQVSTLGDSSALPIPTDITSLDMIAESERREGSELSLREEGSAMEELNVQEGSEVIEIME